MHIDPTEWNRNDGFSPGSLIVTYVPGLDLDGQRRRADHRHRRVARARDQPIVLLDADTGERWPFWAELDARPTPPASTAR